MLPAKLMEAAPRTRRYKNILTSPPTNVAPPISIPPDGTTQVGSGLSSPLRKLHPAHLTHPSPHRIPPSVPRIRREGRERQKTNVSLLRVFGPECLSGKSEIEGGRRRRRHYHPLQDACRRRRVHDGSDPIQDIRPRGPHGRGPPAPRQGQRGSEVGGIIGCAQVHFGGKLR